MKSLILYFLPVILTIGIFTSYEDIKKNKIQNKYVMFGLISSLIIHTILWVTKVINFAYIKYFLIYSIIALIIGFLIWYAGFWCAGDAKLYFIYIMLIPLTTYKHISVNIPIFALIINAVIPAFVYLFVRLVGETSLRKKKNALKKSLDLKYLAKILLIVFSLSWFAKLFFQYIGFATNYIYMILPIMLMARILNMLLKEQFFAFLSLVAIFRIFLNTRYIINTDFLISFISITIGYTVIKLFIKILSKAFVTKINIYKLKKGMILAEAITKKGLKINITDKIDSKIKTGKFLFYEDTGLTEKDILKLKDLHKNGILHFNEVYIHQIIPFAPFLFAGVLITLISEGNALLFLQTLF